MPHMNRYSIMISADLGEVAAPVGAFLKELNSTLATVGIDEKLSVRSKMIRCKLTSPRQLSKEDREKVKIILIEQFNAILPAWKVRVESFRRQSGNVQQSAV